MRVYTVLMANISVSGAITLCQVKPGVSSIVLLRAKVSQSSSTTSAQVDVAIGTSTGAATVTSYTPKPHDLDGAAAKAVGGTTATGVNASGEGASQTDILRDSFNVLTGFEKIFVPEERIEVPGGGGTFLYLRFPSAPSATTFNAELTFGEIG